MYIINVNIPTQSELTIIAQSLPYNGAGIEDLSTDSKKKEKIAKYIEQTIWSLVRVKAGESALSNAQNSVNLGMKVIIDPDSNTP